VPLFAHYSSHLKQMPGICWQAQIFGGAIILPVGSCNSDVVHYTPWLLRGEHVIEAALALKKAVAQEPL